MPARIESNFWATDFCYPLHQPPASYYPLFSHPLFSRLPNLLA